mgnify:CR=1 FL=1
MDRYTLPNQPIQQGDTASASRVCECGDSFDDHEANWGMNHGSRCCRCPCNRFRPQVCKPEKESDGS